MAQTAPRAEIHQTLDVHRNLTPQVALDGEFRDLLAQLFHIAVRQVLDLGRVLDAGRGADRARAATAYAVNRGQRDFRMLMIRNVDATNTGHNFLSHLC
jgi:hypothetical protein